MLQKTEIDNLIRNMDTGALVNTSTSSLLMYKKQKQQAIEFNKLKKDINSINNRLCVVETMLREIIDGNSTNKHC